MNLKKQNKVKIELSTIDTPFTKDTQYDIIGLFLAIVVGITSFYISRPEGILEWSLKLLEFLGILFAGWAIGLMLNKFDQNRISQKEKQILEERAKSHHLSLNKYLSKTLEDITKPIRKWADKNKIEYNYLTYSNYKHTLDFHNFPIDYIDFQVIDYHLEFIIRMHNSEYIKRILKYLLNSELKLVLTLDNYHFGNHPKEKIEQRAIERIKKTLIESILNPSYSIKAHLF